MLTFIYTCAICAILAGIASAALVIGDLIEKSPRVWRILKGEE
jgi:hypothetical protein